MSSNDRSRQARAIRRTGIICTVVFFGMIGAAYAAVPLYRMFCQVTGFDGTTRRGDSAPTLILDQTIDVRFDANVRELPWEFEPEQVSQTVRIGETMLAFYKLTNTSDQPMTGRAIYNVVPQQAGPYFIKLECFCFTDQTLQPGQTMDVPVVYYIDPRYASDFETRGKVEVTLSYTFFPSTNQPDQAQRSNVAAANRAPALGGEVKARL